MKANQFLRNDDDAVSPVIAVILMVAITVVLAATVYVWVSGFGSGTNGSPAHTMSMTSAGAIVAADNEVDTAPAASDTWTKTYTVSSADPTLTYGDIKLTIGGTLYTHYTAACTIPHVADADASQWSACSGSTPRTASDGVLAGDTITIRCHDDDTAPTDATDAVNCLSDKDLLILDVEANSVMITLKVR